MNQKFISGLVLLVLPFFVHGQFSSSKQQYFDGADTSALNSFIINVDTSSTNIWQIGQPQKAIFNAAATFPNAIMTDTSNYYPVNNTSSFSTGVNLDWFGQTSNVLALQWKQKLDMDQDFDGGIIEFSTDTGNTWQNAFNNPLVYRFYGFDQANRDTLNSGEYAFSGTDTTWRNIWLCFNQSQLWDVDSFMFRFTFKSDSIDNNKEGWIIDNIYFALTIIHTVNEIKVEKSISALPNLTDGRITISTEQLNEFQIIEKIELVNIEGKCVQKWRASPNNFEIDISNHPNGLYFLNVKTNKHRETFKIMLEH